MAEELRPHDVACVTLYPGAVQTELMEQVQQDGIQVSAIFWFTSKPNFYNTIYNLLSTRSATKSSIFFKKFQCVGFYIRMFYISFIG